MLHSTSHPTLDLGYAGLFSAAAFRCGEAAGSNPKYHAHDTLPSRGVGGAGRGVPALQPVPTPAQRVLTSPVPAGAALCLLLVLLVLSLHGRPPDDTALGWPIVPHTWISAGSCPTNEARHGSGLHRRRHANYHSSRAGVSLRIYLVIASSSATPVPPSALTAVTFKPGPRPRQDGCASDCFASRPVQPCAGRALDRPGPRRRLEEQDQERRHPGRGEPLLRYLCWWPRVQQVHRWIASPQLLQLHVSSFLPCYSPPI